MKVTEIIRGILHPKPIMDIPDDYLCQITGELYEIGLIQRMDTLINAKPLKNG